MLAPSLLPFSLFFFFNDTATTEIYTLSLHDALPICARHARLHRPRRADADGGAVDFRDWRRRRRRSEEHTSELQSQSNLVCRLLLEKKKKKNRQGRDVYNVRRLMTSTARTVLDEYRY